MKKARGILRRTLVMLLSVFLLNGVFPVDGLIRAAETDEPDTAYGGSNDQTSLAAAPAISYNGTDGEVISGFTDYTPMDSSCTTLNSGTYFVGNDITVESRINVNGTVNLILGDDSALTASKGISVSNGNTLNIFCQSEGEI